MRRTSFAIDRIALALLGPACLIGTFAVPASAQESNETIGEVTVTGYRQSLENAANAKRESTNFTDSVFAEDIGKFTDLNIAESLNRIPGVQLTREVNGEGLNVAIRGLNTNFTKVLLNGHQIGVASSGRTDAQNVNRELDLDLFPTELFNQLTVSKSSKASMIEGGVSGTVDMRSSRPFDFKSGFSTTYQLQGGYGEVSEEYSPRGSVLASWRNDTFGATVGVAAVSNKSTTTGYETIGWTNANYSYAQCGLTPPAGTAATAGAGAACANGNATGGNGWVIPATVPMGTGAGLTDGATIDAAFITANNPGLTFAQIGEAIIPRLSREAYLDGSRDRISGLISLEYRPSDAIHVYIDSMYSDANREFDRLDMDLVGRNGAIIPLNMQVGANNVVTSATFANAQFFLEARPYDEEVNFYDVNPGVQFEFGEAMRLNVGGNYSRSLFWRESPTILVNTPLGVGITAQFDNTGGNFPAVTTNADLNDPDLGWIWAGGGRVNISNEKRVTETQGGHLDFEFGEEQNNLRVGVTYDESSRVISSRDNSARWEDVVCRNGLDANGNSPTPRAACDGLSPNAVVPLSAIGSYLSPGPAGFVTVDFDRFMADTMYHELNINAPENNTAATGANTGSVDEDTWGAYVEFNGETEIIEHTLRINAGVRFITTAQLIGGPVTIAGVRQWQYLPSDYDEYLPSFNAAFDITDSIVARASASRTLTRADPSLMLPNTTFSDPSAQNANQGNPNLAPYLSTNIDFGGEWYTGDEGYVGVALFAKEITGFTVQGTNTIPFLQLGIPFETLSPQQQIAINSRGGPQNATVTVTQQVNATGVLDLKGYELTWAYPLPFLEGLGFNLNYTHVKQKSKGSGVPAIATGISPETYNATIYYENFGAAIRLAYTYLDDQILNGPGQNGLNDVRFHQLAREQLDLSASYEFASLPTSPQLTFEITNITSETQRQPIGMLEPFSNAMWTFYDPGYQVTVGLRGKF